MTPSPEIAGPKADMDIADRYLDCQFALEPAFLDLMDRAEQAGWGQMETVVALTDLADNYMLGVAENARTAEAIRKAFDRGKN